MRRKFAVILALCLSLACFTSADTLKLNNGEVIYGVFMGRNNDAIQFLGPDGSSKSYPLSQVATMLGGQSGRMVVDRTGLTGNWESS